MGKDRKKLLHVLVIIVLDMLLITAAGGIGLLVRFDFSFSSIPQELADRFVTFLPVQLMVTAGIFMLRKMYHYMWRSVSVHDVLDMVVSVLLAFGVCYLLAWIFGYNLPGSVCFVCLMCQLFLLVGMRCCYRFYQVISHSLGQARGQGERIMLIGAGEAGRLLIREILSSERIEGRVCCLIDDDPAKWGKYLEGVRIVGGREAIQRTAKREGITQIIFAIPTASPEEKRDILDQCKMTGCRIRVLPGIYQLVNGEVSLASVKDVQVEDLLGREQVKLDTGALNQFLSGKTVMVTGGGGSIGSELCRQIARYHPKRLIILDIYENNAYDIQQELRRSYGVGLDLSVEIASIRDKDKIYDLVSDYRPDVIFHAAAHKHVPLMEACPEEAIKNNVFGTYHVVRAAEKFGVKKFVMISTDKAVNPTNFMGATKRFCEMILQSRSESGTEFAAVRFGNVLGSNGSVVPLFKQQIQEGGPVTITDKRIIRYFMTIPEASQLVLEAGAMAQQSQIFVLDMGEPVKILTLAENLIRLSGLEPYKDIEIREIGLRPGEKLYEELLMRSETLSKTSNKKIFVEQQGEISQSRIMDALEQLDAAITSKIPDEELIALMKRLVPTYHAPEEVNRQAEQGEEPVQEQAAQVLAYVQETGVLV